MELERNDEAANKVLYLCCDRRNNSKVESAWQFAKDHARSIEVQKRAVLNNHSLKNFVVDFAHADLGHHGFVCRICVAHWANCALGD